jgi:hypothetical protein
MKYIPVNECESSYRNLPLVPVFKRIADGELFAYCNRCCDADTGGSCLIHVKEAPPQAESEVKREQ